MLGVAGGVFAASSRLRVSLWTFSVLLLLTPFLLCRVPAVLYRYFYLFRRSSNKNRKWSPEREASAFKQEVVV